MSAIVNLGQNSVQPTNPPLTESSCTSAQKKFTVFSDTFWSVSSAPISQLAAVMWKIIQKVDDYFYQEKIKNEPTFSTASHLLHEPSNSKSVRRLNSTTELETIQNEGKETLQIGGMRFEIENSFSRRSSSDTDRDHYLDVIGIGFSPELPANLFSKNDNSNELWL